MSIEKHLIRRDVGKIASVVPYPKCYSVIEKVLDFFVNGLLTKYFFVRFIYIYGQNFISFKA